MMDVKSRAYCKTHHVCRMWNFNLEITRNARKGSSLVSRKWFLVYKNVCQFPKNVSQFVKIVTWFLKNVTQFPKNVSQFSPFREKFILVSRNFPKMCPGFSKIYD